jgi:DNA-binding IclR family transcriptional regulator
LSDRKYWAPALEKAQLILSLISKEPSKRKQMDLSKQLGINKSSLFVLLHTMETLEWVKKESDDSYSLGQWFGDMGHAFLGQNTLLDQFNVEAKKARDEIGETIQLAKLDGNHVLYLGKVEAPSQVKLMSEPGMRLPAHATALGKALIAYLPDSQREKCLYSPLEQMTPLTLTQASLFETQLEEIRDRGYATEEQEAVMGFCCVAAPVFDGNGEAVAAVSASIPLHKWELKKEMARDGLMKLAARLSLDNNR